MPTPRSATASPRPAKTTARPTATRAPASRRPMQTPRNGSRSRPEPAIASWAAARSRSRAMRSTAHTVIRVAEPMPARAGIGLRAQHHDDLLRDRPDIGWLEAHSENYFVDGGRSEEHTSELPSHSELV